MLEVGSDGPPTIQYQRTEQSNDEGTQRTESQRRCGRHTQRNTIGSGGILHRKSSVRWRYTTGTESKYGYRNGTSTHYDNGLQDTKNGTMRWN